MDQSNRPIRETPQASPPGPDAYDPFARGRFPVGVRTVHALDGARGRRFPCEIWYPAAGPHAGQDQAPQTQDVFTPPGEATPRRQPAVRYAAAAAGSYPLVVFSHSSGGHRRQSTFLCTHLAGHGYIVAALDHSEVVAPELGPRAGETAEEQAGRVQGWIANRVPDVRFLLDGLLERRVWDTEARPDPAQVGIAGYSFGGWTALAAPDAEPRIRAVVALAPGGSSNPRPGIIPATLRFAWGRDVATLYLVAETDTFLPLAGMVELYERTPATRQMAILRRADHLHFVDAVEAVHEAVRGAPSSGAAAWIAAAMRPAAELCSGEQAHRFVQGLALGHFDAYLKGLPGARRFLAGDLAAELAARDVDAWLDPG